MSGWLRIFHQSKIRPLRMNEAQDPVYKGPLVVHTGPKGWCKLLSGLHW